MWVEATTFKEPHTGYLVLEATTAVVSAAAAAVAAVSAAAAAAVLHLLSVNCYYKRLFAVGGCYS